MEAGWKMGLPEGTPCGKGSTQASTVEIRSALPDIVKKYKIKKINDAGCGDLHWIKSVDLGKVDYKGYDLVPRADGVQQIDISRKKMRKSDLIICRDVFIHLTKDRIFAALENFKATGKYLLTTSYDENENNLISAHRQFSRISLVDEPFNFPEPLLRIEELEEGRWVGLWELSSL